MEALLPLGALLIAVLVVAALWLWWSPSPQGGEDERVPADVPQSAVPLPRTRPSQEVLRVLREQGGMLSIEIGERRYHNLAEVTDPLTRERLLETLRMLAQFAGEEVALSGSPTAPPPQPELKSEPAIRVVQVLPTPTSMADQIEAILQDKLAQMPSMAHREIHIRQTLEGGVRIDVDGQGFSSVEDVPDPEVRSLIQSAIREWEWRSAT